MYKSLVNLNLLYLGLFHYLTFLFLLVLLSLHFFFPFSNFYDFSDIETIHIVNMWINSSGFLKVNMVSLFHEFCQALFSDFNIAFNNFYVSPLKSVVYDFFIFQRGYGTGGINNHSVYFTTIYCSQK